ncbi:MAG: hypothetical protein D6722_21155 [Bacteroidetes bacterium]|nr:MAG: hypothetical protein D6722_21155 [Bacteroidota bacterium]
MARQPRLCALALTWELGPPPELVGQFAPEAWSVYARLLSSGRHAWTSSMGRLFDGVAGLLNLVDENSYEGEAALRLETLAWRYAHQHGLSSEEDMPALTPLGLWEVPTLIRQVLLDAAAGRPAEAIAFRFHLNLVRRIAQQARHLGLRRLGFSGGVFQNALLIDLLYTHLGADHALFFHQALPPNDENIALGQLAWQAYGLTAAMDVSTNQSQNHVFSYSG